MGMFALAQAGDSEALSTLVRQNVALVQALCRRFPYSEDAFQQGCIGLVAAIRHFQEDIGTQFSTYAVPCILGEIKRGLPRVVNWRVRKAMHRLDAAQRELQAALCREPTVLELSKTLSLTVSDVLLLLEQRRAPLSIDETEALLSLPDPHSLQWLDRFLLRDILSRLPLSDKQLLYLRYQLNKSQSQTASALHLTQPSVSRREKLVCCAVRAQWIGEDGW